MICCVNDCQIHGWQTITKVDYGVMFLMYTLKKGSVVVYTASLIAEPRSKRSLTLLNNFNFTGNHVTESHVSYCCCEKGHDHSGEE